MDDGWFNWTNDMRHGSVEEQGPLHNRLCSGGILFVSNLHRLASGAFSRGILP
jgi:hypothetical protein